MISQTTSSNHVLAKLCQAVEGRHAINEPAPVRAGLLAFVSLFILSALWTFTTPPSAGMDEPAHAIKAAGVARGQGYGTTNSEVPAEFRVGEYVLPDGTLATPDNLRHFNVPQEYAALVELGTCMAFDVDGLPTCDVSGYDYSGYRWVVSSASLYNPTFYTLVGWPSLLNENFLGFYGMRLVNAAITSACFALAFSAVARLRNRTVPLMALALTAMPTALFLGSIVNPNGIEIAATVAFTSAVGVALINDSRGRELTALMVSAGAMGLLQPQMRALGFVWLGIATLALFIFAGWRKFFSVILRPMGIAAVAMTALGIGLALWQIMSTSVLTSTVPLSGLGFTFTEGLRIMLEGIGDQFRGIVGTFGWLETFVPAYITNLIATLSGGLVIAAIVTSGTRVIWAIVTALLGYVLVPAIIQGLSMPTSGFIWQGRYSSAAFSIMVVIAGFAAAKLWPKLPPFAAARLTIVALTVIGFSHLVSLYTSLRRYAVGVSGKHEQFLWDPIWLPPFGNSLFWVGAMVVATALFIVTMLRLARPIATLAGSDTDSCESSEVTPNNTTKDALPA